MNYNNELRSNNDVWELMSVRDLTIYFVNLFFLCFAMSDVVCVLRRIQSDAHRVRGEFEDGTTLREPYDL